MSNADEGGVPLIVFVIVIFSAFIHASWNLATRAIKGDLAVLASSCFFGSILLFPAIFFVDYSGNTINLGVVYGFISGVVHIVYIAFVGLMYAHASGNISVVYPIARGTGVCLTAIFAMAWDVACFLMLRAASSVFSSWFASSPPSPHR